MEAVPQADYTHAPPAAVEAFKDIKYGVRIHWGLYSQRFSGGESWPFLQLPFDEKQKYEEAYKTWNPSGFDAEEWMRLFHDSGLRMFAFTSKHHDGFSMFDTKTRVTRCVNWAAAGGPQTRALRPGVQHHGDAVRPRRGRGARRRRSTSRHQDRPLLLASGLVRRRLPALCLLADHDARQHAAAGALWPHRRQQADPSSSSRHPIPPTRRRRA